MTDLEVHNLPLVARNPYNFALVQPGVTGIENVEFGVPRLAANGAAMRINYQIDGNTNTEKDRAGLRLLPMSEVMIQEVKVVTTGFAPEFGQTMGMVYNAVTPSGTNTFQGEGELSVPPQARSARSRSSSAAAARRRPPTARRSPPTPCKPETQRRHRHGRRRRPDRQEQAVLLRRLGADAPRPVVEQPDHRHAGDRRAARPEAAAGRGAERADGEVLDRQGRLPDQQRPPADRALDPVPQRRAVQQRRRHRHARARDRLSRRDGLDAGSARLDVRHEQAERVPRPVRASAPELGGERRFRHRPGDHDQPRRRSRSAARSAAPARATPASTSSRTSRR